MSHGDEFIQVAYFASNKLPESDHAFITDIGSWSVSSGSATLAIEPDIKPYSNGHPHNSLKIVPGNTSPFTLTVDTVSTVLADRRDDIMMHVLFRSSQTFTATILATELTSTLAATTRTVAVPAERWFVARGEGVDIPDSTQVYDIRFSITIEDHVADTPIYLAYPTVMADFAFTDNMFVRECMPLLPEVLVVKDSEQRHPSFPMTRLLDVGSGYAGLAFEQYDHFKYLDIESGKNPNDVMTLSGLVNELVAEAEYLPWLSQFVGVKLSASKSGTTPWENLVGSGALTTWSDLMAEADDDGFDPINLTNIARVAGGDVTATVASVNWPSPAPAIGDTVIIAGTSGFDGQFQIDSVSAGTYEVTFNDGVEWGVLTRDGSGNVVGYIKSDSTTKYLGNPPSWAEVGNTITVSGVTDTSFNGAFTITAVNDSANTIEWNDGTSTAASDSTGYGSLVASETSTGTITQVDSSWLDLELYNLANATVTAYHRDQITHAYNGYNGGSFASLEAAAKQFLRDTQQVVITRHYGDDEWAILVETLTSETPNGVDDAAAESVTSVLDIAKPAGYVVTHFCRATL